MRAMWLSNSHSVWVARKEKCGDIFRELPRLRAADSLWSLTLMGMHLLCGHIYCMCCMCNKHKTVIFFFYFLGTLFFKIIFFIRPMEKHRCSLPTCNMDFVFAYPLSLLHPVIHRDFFFHSAALTGKKIKALLQVSKVD